MLVDPDPYPCLAVVTSSVVLMCSLSVWDGMSETIFASVGARTSELLMVKLLLDRYAQSV